MNIHFDDDLVELKETLLRMGGLVEEGLGYAVEFLINHEPGKKEKLLAFETEINQLHIKIDDICLKMLAVKSPVASDLRFVISVIKINSDLERMGDQVISLYRYSKQAGKITAMELVKDLLVMAKEVQKMVKAALDAFVSADIMIANRVLADDNKVDELKDKIYKALLVEFNSNPQKAKEVLDFNTIIRILERLGDHSTNIAESVIFIETGEDIRHSNLRVNA